MSDYLSETVNGLHLLVWVFYVLEDLKSELFNLVRELLMSGFLKLLEHLEAILLLHLDAMLLSHESNILMLLRHYEANGGALGSNTSCPAYSIDVVLHGA